MDGFLESVSKLTVLGFVISCMIVAGLRLRVHELVAPLRRSRFLCRVLVANFVVVPALAWLLIRLAPLDRSHAIGLILLGGAAGAPFLPKLSEMARGDVTCSVALMLLLVVGSVVFMPLTLPLLIPGLAVDPWPILRPLLFTMILPLAAGVLVRRYAERWATKLRPPVNAVSNVSLVAAVILLMYLNFSALRGVFGTGALWVGLMFVVLALTTGFALGVPAAATRSVVTLGTGQRNIPAALVVATQNFTDPGVAVMLLATTLVGLAPTLLAARWFARRASRHEAGEPTATASRECVASE